jgi:accessory colonization factor AcfC
LNEDGNSSFEILSVTDFASGIQGNSAKQVQCRFNVILVEEGNPSNTLELTDCIATFGFTPNN